MNLPIIAIMYDFDRTLCTRDMQEYQFIPSLGMEASEFWQEANGLAHKEHMDGILAYMYVMIMRAKEKGIELSRDTLVSMGNKVELFPGVDEWFDRINEYGRMQNVKIEHYVISSGLKEIIQGSKINDAFTEIFASEFYYGENDNAVWPKAAVNYTNKTQFVYRINKGVLDISNDVDLNKSMPEDSKRVRFSNMIYIGDGLSDVPCMKMVKAYGGSSIAVYQNGEKEKVDELLTKGRVDFTYPADYRENSGIDITVKNLIRKMSIEETLFVENVKQHRETVH
ncbi:MAG: haloacid dehalogenase-like hydrolase [Ruminococcaceae bacterium]|nr:haloacid dehalogenase-like hydrolase [Oscillospiraceae bacterium]